MEQLHSFQTLIADLWWRSETDEPWHLSRWCWTEAPTPEAIAHHLHLSPPVQTVDLEQFFAPAIAPQPWYGPEEQQTQDRHHKLLTALHQSFTTEVHLFGEVTRTVVIAVPLKPGDWALLTTVQVDT